MNPTNNDTIRENTSTPENAQDKKLVVFKKIGIFILAGGIAASMAACSTLENTKGTSINNQNQIETNYDQLNLNKNITGMHLEKGAIGRIRPSVYESSSDGMSNKVVVSDNEVTFDTPTGVEEVEKTNNGTWYGVTKKDYEGKDDKRQLPSGVEMIYFNYEKCNPIYATPAPQTTNNIK